MWPRTGGRTRWLGGHRSTKRNKDRSTHRPTRPPHSQSTWGHRQSQADHNPLPRRTINQGHLQRRLGPTTRPQPLLLRHQILRGSSREPITSPLPLNPCLRRINQSTLRRPISPTPKRLHRRQAPTQPPVPLPLNRRRQRPNLPNPILQPSNQPLLTSARNARSYHGQ